MENIKQVQQKEWLTRLEVATVFSCSVGTVVNLTKDGVLTAYRFPGSRLKRYKRTEVESALLPANCK